jgi:uncharacterized protein
VSTDQAPTPGYLPRIVEAELQRLIAVLPALVVEGARGVGKTTTVTRWAGTVHGLEDPRERSYVQGNPSRLLEGAKPVLIDEWLLEPLAWGMVSETVATNARPGRFLLTSSVQPAWLGASPRVAEIPSLRMRPLALAERGVITPTMSLGALLKDPGVPVEGETGWTMEDYAREIVASGLPALRDLSDAQRSEQLGDYVARLIDRDVQARGRLVRNPAALRRLLIAYAAASSMPISLETIRDAAANGPGGMPARTMAIPFCEALERLLIVDPVPAWLPWREGATPEQTPAKHQLADPALAALLLGLDLDRLLGVGLVDTRYASIKMLLTALFESLVTLSLRVYAQAAGASVTHLHTVAGWPEIDLIVDDLDGHVLAIMVEPERDVSRESTRPLLELADRIGDVLADMIVITAGPRAYRREDGIAVVPAALLGP